MKKMLVLAITFLTIGNVCLAKDVDVKYVKIPNGVVMVNKDNGAKVKAIFTPFGCEMYNDNGQSFLYYNDTGILYDITDENVITDVMMPPNFVDYIKAKAGIKNDNSKLQKS